MNETPDELAALQELLDRSAGDRARHLTDIATASRQLSAERLSADLRGVLVLNVATVTRAGAPRVSAVDGHFLHGRWCFSTASSALKARHLAERPAVSVGYTPRDGYGVWTHGAAVRLEGGERDRLDAYLSHVYGQALSAMADGIAIFRLEPSWMLGFAMTDDEQSEFDSTLPDRDRRMVAALRELS